MPRMLKIVLVALAAVLALLVAVVAYIAATFDPNAYKPLLIERVQNDYRRTLAIPGRIELTFFPRLGVKLGAASLSERNGAQEFASLRSAQVSLALWPLLRRELVVDRVALAGLRVKVTRFKDGRLSIDDLAGAGAAPVPQAEPAPDAQPLRLDIAGVAITDAAITFDDQQAPRRIVLSKASVETGRFAPGAPMPVALKARLDADTPRLGADLALDGRLVLGPAAGRIAVEALKADLGATLDGSPLKLALTGAFEGDLAAQRYALNGLKLDATLPGPKGPLALDAQGTLAAQLGAKAHVDAKLAGRFDGSTFKLDLGMPRLAPPAFTFDAEVDRLDLDRWRSTAAPAAAPASGAARPEAPLDLSALRTLDATGQLRVGALQVMNLKASALRVGLRAAGGRLVFDPVAADLYQGRLAGSAGVAATTPPRVGLKAALTAVAIGPLLKDLSGKDLVDGRGNVTLDVDTSGTTAGAMLKALAGGAKAELKDGAVRGINVAQAIRKAKARVAGGSSDGTAAKDEATDFSELTASFVIAKGVAHNDDLAAKTPLFRIGGSGDIDIGESRLDYLVKATVVATLEGQGGPELQALRGQTVPVKLSGPFSAVDWKIDFAGMAKEAAKKELDTKGEQLKQEAKDKLGSKLKGLIGR